MYTHTGCSPILAQTFTEPFLVYSAKRFPGVPGEHWPPIHSHMHNATPIDIADIPCATENTPLSTAFAKQGQKLPLVSTYVCSPHSRSH